MLYPVTAMSEPCVLDRLPSVSGVLERRDEVCVRVHHDRDVEEVVDGTDILQTVLTSMRCVPDSF